MGMKTMIPNWNKALSKEPGRSANLLSKFDPIRTASATIRVKLDSNSLELSSWLDVR